MGTQRQSAFRRFVHDHSLTLVSVLILSTWVILYRQADPQTHLGAFYGNAIADWSGVVVTVLATKYLYEKGSAESRKPPHPLLRPLSEFMRDHSLTIFLIITGIGWVIIFAHMNSEAKWGQVVGIIVSEWTQIIGLVLLTKKFLEINSKESQR